ncbi:MAG: hypothetical protein Q4B03_02340 [Lachnospiraceae bacterium]|nr:hypothetical protein [Lachnospiraceae bacterium]
MTKSTNKTNFIIPTIVTLALGRAIYQIFSCIDALHNMAGTTGTALSRIQSNGGNITLLIMVAAMFSLIAHSRGAGKGEIIRANALLVLGGFSMIGEKFMTASESILGHSITATTSVLVKPFLNGLMDKGLTQTEAAAALTRIGTIITAGIAAGLAIVIIISLVSISKKAKAESGMNVQRSAA